MSEKKILFAEGINTISSGNSSHAEGHTTRAAGFSSHAEGAFSIAAGSASHAEGISTLAKEYGSHSEGNHTSANGPSSHAEGIGSESSGIASHSEGYETNSNGNFSHAEGQSTSTNKFNCSHIIGKYGDATHSSSWHLANGTGNKNRSLAARIRNDGIGDIDGGWTMGNFGYAEAFETFNGESIGYGYFVTLDGKKIRKANANDNYVIGVTTAVFAVLGDSGELRWKNKYETDKWGRIKYTNVSLEAVKDDDGNTVLPEYEEKQPNLNSKWDSKIQYISRLGRSEWSAVILLGKAVVLDDGKCQVNGYCRPNNKGVAIPWQKGFRVLERISPHQILILVK